MKTTVETYYSLYEFNKDDILEIEKFAKALDKRKENVIESIKSLTSCDTVVSNEEISSAIALYFLDNIQNNAKALEVYNSLNGKFIVEIPERIRHLKESS